MLVHRLSTVFRTLSTRDLTRGLCVQIASHDLHSVYGRFLAKFNIILSVAKLILVVF